LQSKGCDSYAGETSGPDIDYAVKIAIKTEWKNELDPRL